MRLHLASTAWTLRDRLRVAVKEFSEHNMLYEAFTASMLAENIIKWKAQIEAWEKDDSLPDPYQTVDSGMWARVCR